MRMRQQILVSIQEKKQKKIRKVDHHQKKRKIRFYKHGIHFEEKKSSDEKRGREEKQLKNNLKYLNLTPF